MSHRIQPLDLNWLVMESADTPMHVGALFTFAAPNGAGPSFVADLAEQLRAQRDYAAPWSYRLVRGLRGRLMPSFEVDDELDLDYHFRHSALPHPGGERELGTLVSRLHSSPLDQRRPLWEMHLIEGLSDNRFVLYLKAHHSIIDGVSGLRLMLRTMTDSPEVLDVTAPWTIGPRRSAGKPGPGTIDQLAGALGSVADVADGLRKVVTDTSLVSPYASPRSPLSGSMNGQRRFATQRVSLDLVKSAAQAQGGTVNDVVLWLCGTALRRFLQDSDELPDRPLTTAIPVSLRGQDDNTIGTSVGMILASLGTHIDDPRERFADIVASTTAAKGHLNGMAPTARLAYTTVTAGAMVAGQVVRLDTVLPPMFSLAISNVPGPREPKYLAGARLDGIFPISLLMRQGALNITCVSYGDQLDFGFTGARDALPHLQHIAVYLGEAAESLKDLTPSAPKARPRRRRATSGAA